MSVYGNGHGRSWLRDGELVIAHLEIIERPNYEIIARKNGILMTRTDRGCVLNSIEYSFPFSLSLSLSLLSLLSLPPLPPLPPPLLFLPPTPHSHAPIPTLCKAVGMWFANYVNRSGRGFDISHAVPQYLDSIQECQVGRHTTLRMWYQYQSR